MKILIVAFEPGRWGPVRLAKPLHDAGFEVAALCPANNALVQTRYVDRHFTLPNVRSSAKIEASLADAMKDWQPGLVIPGDERVVASLHALLRHAQAGKSRHLSSVHLEIIIASLGNPESLDSMLLKNATLTLAGLAGVRVPKWISAETAEDAVAASERVGFPVYLKAPFSWAGRGTVLCCDAADVSRAATGMLSKTSMWRRLIRRGLKRDWYPNVTKIDVQKAIIGQPAMYAAVALSGRMLAGFSGIALRVTSPNGPSSLVEIGVDKAMADASSTMIKAFGATGFIGFDFMIEAQTGNAYLIECNPRPIQVGHLGHRIGVDLCAALAAAIGGECYSPTADAGTEVIALFPQEWLRDPDGFCAAKNFIDIPWEDPKLMKLMVTEA